LRALALGDGDRFFHRLDWNSGAHRFRKERLRFGFGRLNAAIACEPEKIFANIPAVLGRRRFGDLRVGFASRAADPEPPARAPPI